MKLLTILLGVLALAGTGAVWWQREEAAALREALEPVPGVTNLLDPENPGNNPAEEKRRALLDQTRELPRLRNEVSQLRALRAGLEQARAENVRLLAAKSNGTNSVSLAGFLPIAELQNLGAATPEAALQTYFWALRDGHFQVMLDSLTPKIRERTRLDQLPPKQLREIETAVKTDGRAALLEHFQDFGISRREDISPEEVVLYGGPSSKPGSVKVVLERVGNDWKLAEFPR